MHPSTTAAVRRLALPALALLLLAGTRVSAPATAAAGPPPRVDNADGPARGTEDVTLVPLWSRGDEDDDLFFGLVGAAVAAPDGGVYVLDSQLSTVYHLAADGELLGTLGREGEGPGEFRRATSLVPLADGTVGVVQRFPGSIVKLHPDGTPAGTILPGDPASGGRDMLTAAAQAPDGLVLSGAHMTRRESSRLRRNFIGLYGTDGTLAVEYVGHDDAFDFNARSFHEAEQDFPGGDRWEALPDGRVAVALERDAYAVTVFSPGGAPALIFGRPAEPVVRDAAELARLHGRWEASPRFQRMDIEQVFAATDPMIADMAVHGDGIWVLPRAGAASADGVLQTWDAFTAAGRWDRRVRLHAPGDGERDRLIFLDDGRALLVSGFRDALEAMFGGAVDAEAATDPVRLTLYRLD